MNLRTLQSWWSVLIRETNLIRRDINIIAVILLAPLFYSFFYGSIYFNKAEQDVPLIVVNRSRSSQSRAFIRDLDAHQLVRIVGSEASLEAARTRMETLQAQGILFIPADFDKNLKSGKSAPINIYLNATRFLIANDINKAINEVVGTWSAGIRLRYFQSQGLSYNQALELAEPLRLEVHPLFNPGYTYGDFLIPGLLMLILQQTLLIGLSESISQERESNTLLSLYQTASKNLWTMIIGKGSYYFILYAAYALFSLIVFFSLFKLNIAGSISALMVLTILFLLSIIYLGFFVSSFFSKKLVSLQFFVFTSYPLFLLSGYTWPTFSMPDAVRWLANFFPSTPYLQAFVRVTQMGAGWQQILPELAHLTLLTLLAMAATRLRMGALLEKETGKQITASIFTQIRKVF